MMIKQFFEWVLREFSAKKTKKNENFWSFWEKKRCFWTFSPWLFHSKKVVCFEIELFMKCLPAFPFTFARLFAKCKSSEQVSLLWSCQLLLLLLWHVSKIGLSWRKIEHLNWMSVREFDCNSSSASDRVGPSQVTMISMVWPSECVWYGSSISVLLWPNN